MSKFQQVMTILLNSEYKFQTTVHLFKNDFKFQLEFHLIMSVLHLSYSMKND